MDDDRKKKFKEIEARLLSGERLTEDDVEEYLHLARDVTLLIINKAVLKEKMPSKPLLSTFNSLQNAVERYEHMHGETKENPLDTMAAAWQAAIDRVTPR